MTSRKKDTDPAAVLPKPDRRTFLQGAIASVMAAALPGCPGPAPGGGPTDPGGAGNAKTTTVTVVRPTDLLVLTFHFVNLEHDGESLVPIDPKNATLVVVELPPQHFFEEAFDEVNSAGSVQPTSDVAPVRHRAAGSSRLCFHVPPATGAIPFDLEKILATISELDLAIAKNAGEKTLSPLEQGLGLELGAPASLAGVIAAQKQAIGLPGKVPPIGQIPLPPWLLPPGKPVKPSAHETSLELPYRLQISPGPSGAFKHETRALERGRMGRVELWHTRLGVRKVDRSIDETAATDGQRTFRALWNRDRDPGVIAPFAGEPIARETLLPKDRTDIVTESADFTIKGGPRKIQARRLMLSSLGGYLDSTAEFNGKATTLLGWDHRAAMGRDSFVRVVRDGHLFPFGHRAVLITVTERKLLPSHPHRAFLWQRQFIVVKEPVIEYPAGNDGDAGHAPLRKNPFTAIEVTALTTPNLEHSPTPLTHYCPKVDGQPYRFHFAATDRTGKVVKFSAPVLWVPADDVASRKALDDDYKAKAAEARPADLRGQRVGFAPVAAPAAGEGPDADPTTFETAAMTFLGTSPADVSALTSRFAPVLDEAELSIPALRAITGEATSKAFRFADAYASGAFGASNAGEVLLAFASDAGDKLVAELSKQSDKVGGFVAPDLGVTGLSRKLGPISGAVDTIASGTFNPEQFFELLNGAKLFGTFGLGDVLQMAGLEAAPKFITETANTAVAFVRDALSLYQQAMAFKAQVEAKAASAVGDAKARLDALKTQLEAVVTAAQRFTQLDLVVPYSGKSVSDQLSALKSALSGLEAAIRAVTELPEPAKRTICAAIAKVRGLLESAADATDKLAALIDMAQKGKELAENLTVRLTWSAPMQPWPKSASKPVFSPKKPLELTGEIRAKASHGRPAGIDLTCALEDFSIDLIGSPSFMVLHFDHLLFKIESDKKPEIDVKFKGMEFAGPLSFIESLRKVIPLDGFSDPPSLDVTPQGIEASFSMALPNVAVGVFSLANISIGAGFKVPFIGDPMTVRFNFCTKEHPFLLTVSLLGGGGYFAMVLDPKGVHSLEAALEFGASLSLDFGVASGEITVVAGIYFKMVGDAVTLTGYLRMRGEVDVLGLISASIELRMELTYESSGGKVIGRASLEIEVEILFFSVSVTLSCERKFKGSNGDPTFRDVYGATYEPCLPEPSPSMMPCVNAWDEYVHAFAD